MKYLLIIFIAIAVMSCAKEEINPDAYITSVDSGAIIHKNDSKLSDKVVSQGNDDTYLYEVDAETVIYAAQSPYATNYEIGKVIIGGISEKAPYGYMRMITARVDDGDRIILSTRDANFDEAFDRLIIDASYRFDGSIVTRDVKIETEILPPVTLGFSSNYTYDIIPEFGYAGDFKFIFDADYTTGEFREFMVR